MRYLIHSDDCTFDVATGKHSILLDRRISNPQHLKLIKCVYEAPTDAGGVYPLAVYLRSGGIHDLIKNKHTIQLTANNHENEADVIAVLKESFSSKRYLLEKERSFLIKQHAYVRSFDFYFTDNNSIIGKPESSLEQAITAAEIATRADMFLFLNFSDSEKVTIDAAAGLLTEIEAVNDSTFEFIPNSGSGIAYADFGSNGGKCAQFNNDWVRLNDASTTDEPLIGTFCVLFKTQPNTTDVQVITDWYLFRLYINTGGALSYYDGSINETSISVENSTDYLLTVRRDNPGNDAENTGFAWRLEKLSDNTVQSDVSFHGGNSPGSGLFDIAGNSSHSAAGMEISNMVVITSISDSDVSTIETYLKQYYRGLESTSSGSASTDATFFIELDVDVS